MIWRLLKTILILPGTTLVVVPAVILWAVNATGGAIAPATPSQGAFWPGLAVAANAVYFPLVEEQGLERRFGDDYRLYKANVPRWVPRLTPWTPPQG